VASRFGRDAGEEKGVIGIQAQFGQHRYQNGDGGAK